MNRRIPRIPMRLCLPLAAAVALLCSSRHTTADETADRPNVLQPRANVPGRVYKDRLIPHWFANNNEFWYRNDLRGGKREYIRVNAITGERTEAFDHQRLAEALADAGVRDATPDRLALDALEFDMQMGSITFRTGGRDWSCNLATYELSARPNRSLQDVGDGAAMAPEDAPRASRRTGPETELRFINRSGRSVVLYWLDPTGTRRRYGALGPGEERAQHTYAGHVWLVTEQNGRELAAFEAEEQPLDAVITGREIARRRPNSPSSAERPRPRDTSPDGKWRTEVRDGNIFLRALASEKPSDLQLTHDGTPEVAYGLISWSPDSRSFVAWRIEPGENKKVYLIESSPPDGGRAILHERIYPVPGDRFASHELHLFRLCDNDPSQPISASAQPRWEDIKPPVEPVDFGVPRVEWTRDGRAARYVKVDRGHQRWRLMEIQVESGRPRTIIDERTTTFIWTAHTENLGIRLFTPLSRTSEGIYLSEVDGWRHMYLIDLEQEPRQAFAEQVPCISRDGRRLFAPGLKCRITQGPWVVRGIDRIDEERRQIWFRAGGLDPDQDPYLVHYCRVNFDGSGFVRLTEGNGHHTVQFSPDERFLIDTYSRVDQPPIHELRRADNGQLVCPLEEADISELTESGWSPPEVFSAKGRDGQTDIWGVIYRPRDFDPNRTYPVIEDIYAGPHGSHVPKTFSAAARYQDLHALGCIVVKIDGMGTANRSKAFHDVCWHNLKDAGFPDRIRWMLAAAARYPQMDLRRVGIYGVSAGGQNAAGAVLFHPEFYKVAVAACGCHDNRLDKASWNEQWMGYPVGPQYAACSNIDNAYRLQGKLLLIVGEMDTNVPPESTLRFVDALIKADKDFEFVVVPGAGHGMGGAYGRRRMMEFFARYLMDDQKAMRN